jgi:hypothetical protein
MKRIVPWIIIILFTVCTGACGSTMGIKKLPLTEKPSVGLSSTGIVMPLGHWALVKRDNRICAVRFLEYGWDKEKPNAKGYAIYEYYYDGEGKGEFLSNKAKHDTGKATTNFFCIFGRLCFDTGNLDLACGKIHIKWHGANSLTFRDGSKEENSNETIKAGVQIAPTKWTDIKEVNVNDTRLKWYKYLDEKLKTVKNYLWVPIEELW